MNRLSFVLALLSAGVAGAAVTPSLVEVPISPAAVAADPTLAGFRTYDLQATITDGDRFLVAGIILGLSQGTFYSPEFGHHVPSPPAAVAAYPFLEFDTYISAPNYTHNVTVFNIPGRLFGTGAAQFPTYGEQQAIINVVWGQPQGSPGQGTFTFARLTVSADAEGALTGDVRAIRNPGQSNPINHVLGFTAPLSRGSFGSMTIPEPTAAAAVATLAMLGLCRRRR